MATNKFPATAGENATENGPSPVENGDPETGVKTPVDVFTEYAETLSESIFVIAANKFPDTAGEKLIQVGIDPADENGAETKVKAPVDTFIL